MVEIDDKFWYPDLNDILLIHENVVAEDPESETGIRNQEQINFVIDYIKHGHFGKVPRTIHEKAFHLMRLLAANHYFVDGNKRTALNTTEIFYDFNNYEFATGEDIRSMLKLLSVEERLLDKSQTVKYFKKKTTQPSAISHPNVLFDNFTR